MPVAIAMLAVKSTGNNTANISSQKYYSIVDTNTFENTSAATQTS